MHHLDSSVLESSCNFPWDPRGTHSKIYELTLITSNRFSTLNPYLFALNLLFFLDLKSPIFSLQYECHIFAPCVAYKHSTSNNLAAQTFSPKMRENLNFHPYPSEQVSVKFLNLFKFRQCSDFFNNLY